MSEQTKQHQGTVPPSPTKAPPGPRPASPQGVKTEKGGEGESGRAKNPPAAPVSSYPKALPNGWFQPERGKYERKEENHHLIIHGWSQEHGTYMMTHNGHQILEMKPGKRQGRPKVFMSTREAREHGDQIVEGKVKVNEPWPEPEKKTPAPSGAGKGEGSAE